MTKHEMVTKTNDLEGKNYVYIKAKPLKYRTRDTEKFKLSKFSEFLLQSLT